MRLVTSNIRRGWPLPFLLFVSVALVLASGCDPTKKARKTMAETLAALDDAIARAGDESENWRDVLEETRDKMTDDLQSTVRNEISSLIAKSVASTGVEARCLADFLRDRIVQDIILIRARFLGQDIPAINPSLCIVDPKAVDRELVPSRVQQIEFYGYDLTPASDLKMWLQTSSGKSDMTDMLDYPSSYLMTMKFGANGVQLDDSSRRFILECRGQQISSVAVIQPETPICESDVIGFRPDMITLVPPHTYGDKDFKGNGPEISAAISLIVEPLLLKARVEMLADETKSDYTRAYGIKFFPLYTPPPGWEIERVNDTLRNAHQYVDTDHDVEKVGLGSGGPAREFIFVGDSEGDDAGGKTKIDVYFNQLQIEITQVTDCVSDRAVASLIENNLIKTKVYQRLKPAMEREIQRRRSYRGDIVPEE